MATLFGGMEQVVTGLEKMQLLGVVRGPDDGSLNMVFMGTGPERHIVWVAGDAEGNGNGALHIQNEANEEEYRIIE